MPVGDLRPTLTYKLYCAAMTLMGPLVWRKVRSRLRDAGVSEKRQAERLGHASEPRPNGRLIWFHAASVGESLSVLSLITRLGDKLPDAAFLITSGTPTSATLIAKRLPPRTRHQYPPLDTADAVHRFLNHWQPDTGIFVESEIWPRLIVESANRDIPLALLNARLSEKSVAGWKKRPKTARFILNQFRLFLTQNDKTAANLMSIGAQKNSVLPGTNLKAMSDPLPVDTTALSEIKARIEGRPVWIASSTHAGEEETVLAAHKDLLVRWPDLLLLLIPRHPERRGEITDLINKTSLTHATRSAKQPITSQTQVYMADTLGELGTWYALCPIVFLGGSLREIGGHNPFEPAQAGAAVITGPGYFNFAETYAPLIRSGGAVEIHSTQELARTVDLWLKDHSALTAARAAAQSFVNTQANALDKVVDTLCARLDLTARNPSSSG